MILNSETLDEIPKEFLTCLHGEKRIFIANGKGFQQGRKAGAPADGMNRMINNLYID
jgi:hypothetical protein